MFGYLVPWGYLIIYFFGYSIIWLFPAPWSLVMWSRFVILLFVDFGPPLLFSYPGILLFGLCGAFGYLVDPPGYLHIWSLCQLVIWLFAPPLLFGYLVILLFGHLVI